MWGRCSLIADLRLLARSYRSDGDWLTLQPAYNIAPNQAILTDVGDETPQMYTPTNRRTMRQIHRTPVLQALAVLPAESNFLSILSSLGNCSKCLSD